ncbi:MAG TPA: SEC-C metal-binding domain-containing protein [Chondromyces sp.]|nr:SEC-C metal-binding domain-containing protein [Chondromyces sp.]
MTIGRNEPCPCGSGKKYKKCCGRVEGEAIYSVLFDELENLQRELIDYALERYSVKMKRTFQSLINQYSTLSRNPQVFLAAFEIWYILTQEVKNGTTILDEFVALRKSAVHRDRTKASFTKWPEYRLVAGEIVKCENNLYHIHDVLANETMIIRSRQNVQLEGAFVMGGLLPFENEYTFFMIDFHFDQEIAERAKERLLELCKKAEQTPQTYLKENFLYVLDSLFTLYDEPKAEEEAPATDDLEWPKESQKKTAVMLKTFFEEENIEEIRAQTALLLWNLYCQEENPTIRKPEIYAAALYSLMSAYSIVEPALSNAELAKRFNVSAPSISKRAKDLEEVLRERLEDGKRAAEAERTKELQQA